MTSGIAYLGSWRPPSSRDSTTCQLVQHICALLLDDVKHPKCYCFIWENKEPGVKRSMIPFCSCHLLSNHDTTSVFVASNFLVFTYNYSVLAVFIWGGRIWDCPSIQRTQEKQAVQVRVGAGEACLYHKLHPIPEWNGPIWVVVIMVGLSFLYCGCRLSST